MINKFSYVDLVDELIRLNLLPSQRMVIHNHIRYSINPIIKERFYSWLTHQQVGNTLVYLYFPKNSDELTTGWVLFHPKDIKYLDENYVPIYLNIKSSAIRKLNKLLIKFQS